MEPHRPPSGATEVVCWSAETNRRRGAGDRAGGPARARRARLSLPRHRDPLPRPGVAAGDPRRARATQDVPVQPGGRTEPLPPAGGRALRPDALPGSSTTTGGAATAGTGEDEHVDLDDLVDGYATSYRARRPRTRRRPRATSQAWKVARPRRLAAGEPRPRPLRPASASSASTSGTSTTRSPSTGSARSRAARSSSPTTRRRAGASRPDHENPGEHEGRPGSRRVVLQVARDLRPELGARRLRGLRGRGGHRRSTPST